MAIEFPYFSDTGLDEPLVPVKLKCKRAIDAWALVDSGASISIISESMENDIGCDMSGPSSESTGIGGAIRGVRSAMSIVLEQGEKTRIVLVPVDVVSGDPELPVLIGRQVFFDLFNISFKKSEDRIVLEPVPLEA